MATDNPFIQSLNPPYIQPNIQIPSEIVYRVTNTAESTSDSPPSSQHPVQTEPLHIIPEIGRKLGATAWRQVVKDWEEADPSRCHDVALKDWNPDWHRSSCESVKYGQRQMIAIEFIERWVCDRKTSRYWYWLIALYFSYNRDEEAFKKAYPEYQRGIMPLLNAIRAEQQRQGLCHRRRSRRTLEVTLN